MRDVNASLWSLVILIFALYTNTLLTHLLTYLVVPFSVCEERRGHLD